MLMSTAGMLFYIINLPINCWERNWRIMNQFIVTHPNSIQVLTRRPVTLIHSTKGHDASNIANVHYSPTPEHDEIPHPGVDHSPRGFPIPGRNKEKEAFFGPPLKAPGYGFTITKKFGVRIRHAPDAESEIESESEEEIPTQWESYLKLAFKIIKKSFSETETHENLYILDAKFHCTFLQCMHDLHSIIIVFFLPTEFDDDPILP